MCIWYGFMEVFFSATACSKLKSAYNKCIKKMFGYTRRDSMPGVFLELSLPTLDTIVHNSCVLLANQCRRSCNKIVQWFLTTGWAKKVNQRSLHITSSNTVRFSKFFHCHILLEICNKAVIKYPTSPQTCCHTTLWNAYVSKLVRPQSVKCVT